MRGPDRGLEGSDGSKGKKITEGCCFVSSNSKKRRESTGAPRVVISSFPEKEQKCFAVRSFGYHGFLWLRLCVVGARMELSRYNEILVT
jgi:hypothetical protein